MSDFPFGRGHLAGNETSPDKIIELVLLIRQERLDIGGCQVHVRRTDCLVRLLGRFLGGEDLGFFGQVGRTEPRVDMLADFCDRLF